MDYKKRLSHICFCIIIILSIIIPPHIKSFYVKGGEYELPYVGESTTKNEQETGGFSETTTETTLDETTVVIPETTIEKTSEGVSETTTETGQDESSATAKINIKDVTFDETQIKKTIEYNGKSRTPILKLSYGDRLLYPLQDYEVEYDNNINAGTAVITITGIGDFTDSITKEFEILKKPLSKTSISIEENANHTVSVEISNPESGKSLTKGVDFSYITKKESNGDIIVTIKASEVNYTGTVTRTIKGSVPEITTVKLPETTKAKVITVKKTEIKKATNIKKKKIRVTWKKVSKATGYEIRFANNKRMKNAQIKKVKKNITEATIKKLLIPQKYYIQIRAYRIISKKAYYSLWSKKRKINAIQ